MWTMQNVIILVFLTIELVTSDEEFIEYTHESVRIDNGKPCLTGCSPDTHECITEARGSYIEKHPCKTLDKIAPIYLTTQREDPESKHCVSNCGTFNAFVLSEWCFTSKDFSKWDSCSSNIHRTSLSNGQQQGVTSSRRLCIDECSKSRETPYLWCHYHDNLSWDPCAFAALPRIPVLQNTSNFRVGEKKKGKCCDFLRYNSAFEHFLYSTAIETADNYVIDIAEAIEAIGNTTISQVFTLNEDNNPVTKYSMVNISNIMVPAVIRAHITNHTINLYRNTTEISSLFHGKLQEQMVNASKSFVAGTLIGFDLGGPNAEYNIVPRASSWKTDDWADMEHSVSDWCCRTDGSVDMLIVVFYRDEKTPIPKAFGISQLFRNPDNSVFVDCREIFHWNSF